MRASYWPACRATSGQRTGGAMARCLMMRLLGQTMWQLDVEGNWNYLSRS
jgi:hypothetical protein